MRPIANLTTACGPGTGPGGGIAPRRASAGFSLVEVLLAALLLGTVMVAGLTAFTTSVDAQDTLAGDTVTAFGLAREIHTLAETLPRDAGSGSPAARIADVTVLDDLNGARFSPPVDAARRTMPSAAGWTQTVAVEAVRLSAPGTLATDSDGDAVLHRLTVAVDDGQGGGGTYTWWLPK